MNMSDIIMEVFAMESSLLRSRKLAAAGGGANAADACAVYLRDAIGKIELASRTVLSACSQGEELRWNLSRLRAYGAQRSGEFDRTAAPDCAAVVGQRKVYGLRERLQCHSFRIKEQSFIGTKQGRGEPVLLIMGLGYPSSLWHRTRPMLAQDFRTVALDNRGVGLSDVPSGPYSISTMASDAAAVLDAAGVSNAHVFGVSMGGMVAQEFALQYPARTRSLILGCTSPGGPSVVRAERKVSDILMARDMSLEQARAAILPYIYDADTPREKIEEDVTLRRQCLPSQEGYNRSTAGNSGVGAYSRIAQITGADAGYPRKVGCAGATRQRGIDCGAVFPAQSWFCSIMRVICFLRIRLRRLTTIFANSFGRTLKGVNSREQGCHEPIFRCETNTRLDSRQAYCIIKTIHLMNFANADTLRAIMEIRRPEARSVGSFLSVLNSANSKTKNKKNKNKRRSAKAFCPGSSRVGRNLSGRRLSRRRIFIAI